MLRAIDDISLSCYGKLSLVHIRNFLIITDVLPWKKRLPCDKPCLLAASGVTKGPAVAVSYLGPLCSPGARVDCSSYCSSPS
jgi:hypothetical protein